MALGNSVAVVGEEPANRVWGTECGFHGLVEFPIEPLGEKKEREGFENWHQRTRHINVDLRCEVEIVGEKRA